MATTEIPASYILASYRMTHTLVDDPMIVTMGWGVAVITVPSLAVSESIIDAFITRFTPQLGLDFRFTGGTCAWGPQPGTGPTFDVVRNVAGTGSAARATPNVAYLVRKRSVLGGRRHRGRIFIPGVHESNVDEGGNVISSYVTILQGVVDGWIADTKALPDVEEAVILHAPGNTVVPPPTKIEAMQVQTKVGTQRRRLR